jgi:uncharacterized protein (DUF2236 family)
MNPPLFRPDSMFWRVNREIACTLAGPRAVLMQIAHPLIAAGVADHSRFREHRLARLYRTSMAAAAITFGSRDFAVKAVNRINQIHTRIHGVLREEVGAFAAGTPYDANDPELKLWVLSTITDSTLLIYDRFVSPLSREERELFYRDSLIAAKLFDIPESAVPPTYDDFQDYMRAMLDGNAIRIGKDAREIAAALFSPSPVGKLLFAGSVVGIGLLPERLRREFGFEWTERSDVLLDRSGTFATSVRRYSPSIFFYHPAAVISQLLFKHRRPDSRVGPEGEAFRLGNNP